MSILCSFRFVVCFRVVLKSPPLCQVYVSQDLERDPPEVVDIRVPMTAYMVGIQKAVIEVMDACLKERPK